MKKLLLSALMLISLVGCSSIVSKSVYDVKINSTPQGANFTITNKAGNRVSNGVTPATVQLESSSGYFSGEFYRIEFTKPGFYKQTYFLKATWDGWYFANLIIPPLPFIWMLVVDPLTGAMWNLPESVNVSLDKRTASSENPNSVKELKITTYDSLTDEEKSRLQRIM